MRYRFCLFVVLGLPLLWHLRMPCVLAQQTGSDPVELRGKVVNSVTGEPVAGALVQIYAPGQKAQFTTSDGTFAFSDLPPGSYTFVLRKPGFFNDQSSLSKPMVSYTLQVPRGEPVLVKLTPEAIIYGEVKNENGEPLEGVSVKAQQWHVVNGEKQLAAAGNAITDDEGSFRLAELRQGRYYLSFSSTGGGWSTTFQLSSKKQEKQGYGTQFYPGVPDLKSATVIEIRPGAQVHIVQALTRERLFQVAGVVHGADPENGFNLMLMNTSGDIVQKSVSINPKTGQFQIQGVSAGPYVLRVIANRRPTLRSTASGLLALSDEQPPLLIAALPLQVYGDLSGLVVMLGTGTSIGVQVHDETAGNSNANYPHQVLLQMTSHEFSSFSTTIMMPPYPNPNNRRATTRFEGLAPDTYTVEAQPNGPWYISSLRCGSVDLLRDDLTVSPGAALPPIEVTLRGDGAQLTVKVTENAQPAVAGVLLFSPDFPRQSQFLGSASSLSKGNLAPGRYYVIAMRGAENVEFRNPTVMERYLAHATEVTLEPRANVTVAAEVQQQEEQSQ